MVERVLPSHRPDPGVNGSRPGKSRPDDVQHRGTGLSRAPFQKRKNDRLDRRYVIAMAASADSGRALSAYDDMFHPISSSTGSRMRPSTRITSRARPISMDERDSYMCMRRVSAWRRGGSRRPRHLPMPRRALQGLRGPIMHCRPGHPFPAAIDGMPWTRIAIFWSDETGEYRHIMVLGRGRAAGELILKARRFGHSPMLRGVPPCWLTLTRI